MSNTPPKPDGLVLLERLNALTKGCKFSEEPPLCPECVALRADPWSGGCFVTPPSHHLPNAPPCRMNP